jgi:hypothetical protein
MIKKERIKNELYVYIFCPIKRKWDLMYKRWIGAGYGVVMDRTPFTANDIENQKY